MPHLPNSALWVQVFIATAVAKVIFPVGFAAKGYINCSVVKKVVLSNHTYSLLLFAHTHWTCCRDPTKKMLPQKVECSVLDLEYIQPFYVS